MVTQPFVMDLQAVDVRLGRRLVLRDITLSIAPGEAVALVGANGSGKSTLLRVLHGLLTPSAGTMRAPAGLKQAMVFQRPLVLRASARSNVALALWLKGMGWRQAGRVALDALARVGLAGRAEQAARTLSGGQQQRLALAWILDPDVLLLDEPTANLDPHAKRDVEALVADFRHEPGHRQPVTLVFASHNLGQVKRLATRVIYLEQGRVHADLPVAEFFDMEHLRARSPEAAMFVKGEWG